MPRGVAIATISGAIHCLRKYIGPRGEHHAICQIKQHSLDSGKNRCDCFAYDREEAHKALDTLEEYLREV